MKVCLCCKNTFENDVGYQHQRLKIWRRGRKEYQFHVKCGPIVDALEEVATSLMDVIREIQC